MSRFAARSALLLLLGLVLQLATNPCSAQQEPRLSDERVVFQLEQGDIEFAFLPDVAPVTAKHIFTLVQLGLYTSNHFFRVDKGFVAQTADVSSGRTLSLNEQQKEHAFKNVPLEVKQGVKHVAGVLSMGRYDDPNSGTSSFSILLGNAPHLDMQYTIFAKVTRGMEVLRKLEELPTRREGIFVMPLNRITILNSYWYRKSSPVQLGAGGGSSSAGCDFELSELKARYEAQEHELQSLRKKLLP